MIGFLIYHLICVICLMVAIGYSEKRKPSKKKDFRCVVSLILFLAWAMAPLLAGALIIIGIFKLLSGAFDQLFAPVLIFEKLGEKIYEKTHKKRKNVKPKGKNKKRKNT